MHGMIKKLELPKLDSEQHPPDIAKAGPSFDVQRGAPDFSHGLLDFCTVSRTFRRMARLDLKINRGLIHRLHDVGHHLHRVPANSL
jgi:hypothetical protein